MGKHEFGKRTAAADYIKPTGREFFQLMKFYSNKCTLFWNLFLSIIGGACCIAVNLVMGQLMDELVFVSDHSEDPMRYYDIIVDKTLLIFATVFAQITSNVFMMGARVTGTPEINVDLRNALFQVIIQQDIPFFDKAATGVLLSRLSEDTTLVSQTYFDKGFACIQYFTQIVAGIIVAFFFSWRVAAVCIPCIILSIIVYFITKCITNCIWDRFNKKNYNSTDQAEEVLTSFRVVRSYDMEMTESQLYSQTLDTLHSVYDKTSTIEGIRDGIIMLFSQGMMAILFYTACKIVIDEPSQGLTIGDILVLMMSIMNTTSGISALMSVGTDFKKANIAAAKLLYLFHTRNREDPVDGEQIDAVRGKIEFRKVSFKYPGSKEWALKDFSMIIYPGQNVAIVGESGCGKSTAIQLLMRFYDWQKGKILIDDVDVRQLAPAFVRSIISLAPQGPVLFSMSIRDNIRYADMKANESEVSVASHLANAHDFIMQCPRHYETLVHKNLLSGGQKQRIAIARAIMSNTPVMVFDEATSSLDSETEGVIQRSLDGARSTRTTITIAHRISTIKDVDNIFVCQKGRVVESGTFNALMDNGGLFVDLVKHQLT